MSISPDLTSVPEFNVTGQDYTDRDHFRYDGPIIDIHSHVMVTRPNEPVNGPPKGEGPGASTDQAKTMLEVAETFGIERTYTMCLPEDVPVLKNHFGDQLGINGPINKKELDSPDDEAYHTLDRFLELGAEIIKFWAAPRGRDRGLTLDTPWRIECTRLAQAAGIKVMMVHVADPDTWFRNVYTDESKYGTKESQYIPLRRMLSEFPDLKWIGAHMGGDPEHPDHLEELLETYPNFYLDTSATKWVVREVSQRRVEIASLICRYPDRFLFGSDLVTRHLLDREHYVSRYWCQRTLWESDWKGNSPIADPDHPKESATPTPLLHGLRLPLAVLKKVYYDNAREILGLNK